MAYLSGIKDQVKQIILLNATKATPDYIASFEEPEPTHAQKVAATP